MIYFQGTIEFQNAVFKATGSTKYCGHIATSTGTVKIHSGTLIDAGNSQMSKMLVLMRKLYKWMEVL